MGFDSPTHWLIVVVVLAALFGYKKLPDMSRSVARSLRIFKTEMKGLTADDAARENQGQPPPSQYGANPYTPSPLTPAAPAPPATATPPIQPGLPVAPAPTIEP